MKNSCEQCARLWREYADTTTTHVRLEGKLEIAALSHDTDAMTDLTPVVERAASARADARAAIRQHENVGHPTA